MADRPNFRRPWARPASPGGERWKFVIIPRRTPQGWKAFCWLRRSTSWRY